MPSSCQRQAEQAAVLVGRHAPGLAVERDVDQRMAERRQLPVEHADHARLGGMEHHVADAEVAVAQRLQLAVGHALGQPRDDAIERRVVVVAAPELRPLLGPALQLSREVVAGPAVVGEADRCDVEAVDRRHRADHRIEQRRALVARQPRCRELVEHAAVELLHQVERRAEHFAVGAVVQRSRHRHVGVAQRAEHAVLAVDRVRRRQHHPARLLAQHRLPPTAAQEVGGVRHAALGAAHFQRAVG